MENMKSLHKDEIDVLQNQIKDIKNEFLQITDLIQQMELNKPEIETLNVLYNSFSYLIFNMEEIGKKSSALFVNKNLYTDSTELSKYFYQILLKIESLKEAYLAKDRTTYNKYLTSLKRNITSTEYVLSLLIGELASEITESLFRPLIEEKKTQNITTKTEELTKNMAQLNSRVEKCEKKISLMIKKNPTDFLENDEAHVLKEVIELHKQNVSWIEPRFIEKTLPITKKRIDEALEELAQYEILQYKMRGGIKVYKYGEQDDNNKD